MDLVIPVDDSGENIKTTHELLEIRNSVLAIASQYGYTGSTTPDVLEENIRQSSQRIGMEMIAIGASLKMLKLQCGHGEFMARVERSGFGREAARKLMLVADKFSNSHTSGNLEKLGKAQITELALGMDKEEVDQLMSGEEVRGIDVNDVRMMTVRELREKLKATETALEDSKSDYEARGKVLENKQKQIDDMAEKLAKKQKADLALPEDEMEKAIRAELTSASMGWMSTIMVTMKDGIQKLLVEGEKTGTDHRPFLSDMLTELENKLHYLREEFVVYSGSAPEPWEDPDYYDKYETVDGQLVEKATGKVVKG